MRPTILIYQCIKNAAQMVEKVREETFTDASFPVVSPGFQYFGLMSVTQL